MGRSAKNFTHSFGIDFERLSTDIRKGRVRNPKLNSFFTRPVYYGTSQQIDNKDLNKEYTFSTDSE